LRREDPFNGASNLRANGGVLRSKVELRHGF
jgi:hypothetical protein